MVTPNNLTIDAYAIFDTSREPVVVHVPKLDEPRWYIVQIGNAFDDVICNLGGTRPAVPGSYLITGPDYHGRVPGDMTEVRSRTRVGFVAVRIAVSGAADLAGAVRAQEGFHLAPLRTYLVDGITNSSVDYGPIEFDDLTAPDDLMLFDRLGVAMRYMLPVDADVNDALVQALATIGLSVGRGFAWQSLDESTLAGLRRAAPLVERIIDERWATMSDTVNGWRGSRSTGRCSYDWALNAANTKNQVGTELADQVVYLNCPIDANDQPLNGSNQYVLHFEPGQTPPAAGMWNLAMYDDAMFFVANQADRFTIGRTTDGMTNNPDGSLTIYIQHRPPDDSRAANWLPAPEGSFNLTMRFYSPQPGPPEHLQAARRPTPITSHIRHPSSSAPVGRERAQIAFGSGYTSRFLPRGSPALTTARRSRQGTDWRSEPERAARPPGSLGQALPALSPCSAPGRGARGPAGIQT